MTPIHDRAWMCWWREVHPKVAAVLPLSRADHAHELVEHGQVSGKVVLTPDTAHQQ